MVAAGLWWQRAVAVLVIGCAQVAHAAAPARLVVVPSQRTQAPDALATLAGSMATPLAEVATLVPTAQYLQAGQMARMGPHLASGSAGAVLLGTQVGASHALYLRASSESVTVGKRRKRTRDKLTLAATLVDTATGETLLFELYPAGARGFDSPEFVAKVVADVKTALTAAPPSALAASVPAAAPTEAPGAATAPGAGSQDARSAPLAPAAKPPAATAAPVPAPPSYPVAASTDPYGQIVAQNPHRPTMALGVRAQLGLMVFGRQATLSSLDVPRMQYGLSRTGSGPALSQGTLGLEVFPVQMVRRNKPRALIDGVGVHVGGSLGWPKTRINATSTATSLTSHLRVGLTLRHEFGQTNKSPELALRLGFNRYAFALPQASVFPGLSYSSVYIDVSGIVPLGTPYAALVAEAAIMPGLRLGDQGPLLGVHRGGGVGAWVEAGLRISPVRHFDILALFDWQHYGADFAGSTVLPVGTSQYANVSVREVSLGGRLAVGTRF